MKRKWFFSVFVLTLVLLGYDRQQAYVPNQEIVMQFVDADVTCDVTQIATTLVKKQLETIGVSNIQVWETAAGRLKITYYSDVDVASIKRLFSEAIHLELSHASMGFDEDPKQDDFPLNHPSNGYDLNVCEIQNSYDAQIDFNGHLLKLRIENESYYNPVLDMSFATINQDENKNREKVAYAIQKNKSLKIYNTSITIPEGRAGPITNVIF